MVRQVNKPSPFDPASPSTPQPFARRGEAAKLPVWIKPSGRLPPSPPVPSSPIAPSTPQSISEPISPLPALPEFVPEPGVMASEPVPKLKSASPELPSPELPSGLATQGLAIQGLATQVQSTSPTRSPKTWRWSMVCIGSLAVLGSIGMMAYLGLASLPPLPNCQTVTARSPDAQRLYCAQEMARSGELKDLQAGIVLVKDWAPTHFLYRDAQKSLAKWSKLVVLDAREKIDQNDYKGAINALNQIPESSPIYAEAQATLKEWKEQWQEGETLYTQAQDAIKKQDWRGAFDRVAELGYLDHDYWRLQQADGLANQISVQKRSREALTQAKKLAKKAEAEQIIQQLGEAIVLLQEVAPETDAWAEAQTLLSAWSQRLLSVALKYWQAGDLSGATQFAQQVPLRLELAGNAQDLVKFSHAHQLAEDSAVEGKLSWKQLWNLVEAITAVQQIQPDSLVYGEAQARLQDWQRQYEDLQQLQMANLIAELGQKPSLGAAITRAQTIAPDRQRYPQAEAMITQWQHQIQQLEDLPYLNRAQNFAASNTVDGLLLAIAQASVLPRHRSLWSEAQTQILSWQQQIEKIEDQPLMDKAQTLAKNNKLDEAIVAASEVRPNRALYDTAQAAIITWKEKIRAAIVAEDRSVLDRAYGFAGSGRLTDAIGTAAQLSPGRPLYLEAQSAIGAWLRERDGNLKTSEDVAAPPDSSAEPLSGETSDAPSTLETTEAAESSTESSNSSDGSAPDTTAPEMTDEALTEAGTE